jgi:hypothetical protein
MNRRDFLKLGGVVSAMLVVPLGSIVREIDSLATVELNGTTYRGTPDGKVYTSADGGRTWSLLTNFGSGITVFSLIAAPRNRIYARLGFASKSFGLVYSLKDGNWRTA